MINQESFKQFPRQLLFEGTRLTKIVTRFSASDRQQSMTAAIFQVRHLQSVLIFSIFNHPCSVLVACHIFGLFWGFL